MKIRDTLRNIRKKKDTPVRPESFTSKGSSKKVASYQSNSFTAGSTPRKDAGYNEKDTSALEFSTLSLQDENYNLSARNRASSHGSDITNCTSATEVRERASTITVLKNHPV